MPRKKKGLPEDFNPFGEDDDTPEEEEEEPQDDEPSDPSDEENLYGFSGGGRGGRRRQQQGEEPEERRNSAMEDNERDDERQESRKEREARERKFAKRIIIIVIVLIAIIAAILLGTKVFDTVEQGTYQVKQAAVSGEMSAKMTPGMWSQWFGDITVWPTAETFYFTADKEGGKEDWSIEVRFNDGSLCHVSGTCRVLLPTSEQEAIDLVTKNNFKDYDDLESKFILPVIRNAMRLTANLMSARESYTTRRPDFNFWSWDQIEHGLYETEEVVKEEVDAVTGEKVEKSYKVIKRDQAGSPIYQKNPMEGMGILLKNFEIKQFKYSNIVSEQIEKQQKAYMEVEIKKAEAQKADQEAKTKEAEGKAAVMQAKYEQEQEKVRATVQAQKEKEVAETQAKKNLEVAKTQKEQALVEANKEKEVAETAAQKVLEVAKLEKQAAEYSKQKEILLGEGESQRRKLMYTADDYAQIKIDAFKEVNYRWADAFAKRQVPSIVIGAGTGTDTDKASLDFFSQAMFLLVAKQLGLDLDIANKNTHPETNTPSATK